MKKTFLNLPDNSQGIIYAILGCLFASILIAVARFLSAEFHVFFIIMMRNLFGFLFLAPQIARDYRKVLYTKRPYFHLFRGVNGLVSMMFWYSAIAVLPLSEAVSISFVAPILTTLAAVIFLKEKVKTHNWIATFIGFIGILIILRPGFKEFNPAYLYSFAAICTWVISNVSIKLMTRTEAPRTIVTYMSFLFFIGSIPFAWPYIKAISFDDLLWFIVIGIVSNLTYFCMSHSYAKSDLSYLQPFDFMRLIFIAIIAYFAFGEILDFWVLVGSLVILCGVIIVMPKKKKKF